MTDLRKLAKGRECQVRTPACNADRETVVLAHIRQAGISGMGLKAPDLLGAYCCSSCHSYVDQQTSANREARELLLLKGVMRTQAILIKEGIIQW